VSSPTVQKSRWWRRGNALSTAPISPRWPLVVTGVALIAVVLVSTAIGPADLSISTVIGVLLSHVPLVHYHSSASTLDQGIVWEIRLPRVILGGIVGAMLAAGGASYQGVFRNPLADPYLLGVAAGAGLGATIVIVSHWGTTSMLPVAAFIGGTAAVTLTYLVGAKFGGRSSGTSVVLAGVAVAALFTAAQTALQQQHSADLQAVYAWILGSLNFATWSDVWLILPYVVVSTTVLLMHRRLLDVLRLGE
jgi:iron complex transport system permease protein